MIERAALRNGSTRVILDCHHVGGERGLALAQEPPHIVAVAAQHCKALRCCIEFERHVGELGAEGLKSEFNRVDRRRAGLAVQQCDQRVVMAALVIGECCSMKYTDQKQEQAGSRCGTGTATASLCVRQSAKTKIDSGFICHCSSPLTRTAPSINPEHAEFRLAPASCLGMPPFARHRACGAMYIRRICKSGGLCSPVSGLSILRAGRNKKGGRPAALMHCR
jgi:hypothetical protein